MNPVFCAGVKIDNFLRMKTGATRDFVEIETKFCFVTNRNLG